MKFNFYVQMDGEVFGPYSTVEIMNLGLLDDVLVTEESMGGEWIPAGQFDFASLLAQENQSESFRPGYEEPSQGNVYPPSDTSVGRVERRIPQWVVYTLSVVVVVIVGWLVWQKKAPTSGETMTNGDMAITVKGITFIMKPVEGGTFMMGGSSISANENATPVHAVTVDGFYMGEFEFPIAHRGRMGVCSCRG